MERNKQITPAQYVAIRNDIESNWPAWKIAIANDQVITSIHAKKLKRKDEKNADFERSN